MSPEDRQFAADRLTPLSAEAREELRATNPALPNDYLDWMSQVGWGDLFERLMLYSGPVAVGEVYGANAPAGRPVAIGDDMAGYVVGIDLAEGCAIEWGPKGEEVARWPTFSAFVSERIAQLRADVAAQA